MLERNGTKLYNAVQAQGRTVVGGAGGTVGAAGGWIMGGGHSALLPRHGLGTFHHFILDISLFNVSSNTTL
jgi:hypothetical protein